MISREIAENLKSGSMIRKMFEEGTRLKKIYGAEHVYDFSIGNPDMEPPVEVLEALRQLINLPNIHKYMPNAGYPDVRTTIAQREGNRAGIAMGAQHIIMTVGAAGGLNAALKALLDPGDEVIVIAPYFVEYFYYIKNHGGVPVVAKSNADTFLPDCAAIAAAITEKTKAIIINSPNNPTGVVYDENSLQALACVLEEAEIRYKKDIYVLSDEPYASLLYEGVLPSTLTIFKNGLVINSFSKSLSLPGERIGYIAVNPLSADGEQLMAALAFTNRTLGYVNAPSLFQRVVGAALNAKTNVEEYRIRRDMLFECITALGMECIRPSGAFYLFPKVKDGDDRAFAARAAEEHILVVPGSAFGWPGHVRIAYCVDRGTIERSMQAWERLLKN